MRTSSNSMNTKKMVKLAMMVAISCVLVLLIRIPFPLAPFLVYDPADIPIYITAFAFGPIAGILVTLVVSFIQAFVLGGDGIYGFIMHFIATGAFAVIVGVLYQRSKTRKTAIVAIVIGVFVMTVIMCIMNLVVTPIFMGVPVEAVKDMLLPIIVPFNLLKGGINGTITFLVYKRISKFLHNE
ncbi:MAG: ECF transporter S component [Peptostreptococcaceae bacterium]|nr:ECF transporter S component [Peptostreptococcaceae bacterium]